MEKEQAYEKIKLLVERFNENIDDYKKTSYNETETRREFLDPFFQALGWDMDNKQGKTNAYKEVIHEYKLKIGNKTKAPDYSFRNEKGNCKFFIEAKKPSINIKSENEAGLISAVTSSDGQLLANSTNAGFIASNTEICAGDTVYFTNSSTDAVSYNWIFEGAETVNSTLENPFAVYNNQGIYNVTLNAYGLIDSVSLLQSNYITVNALPVAGFGVSDTLLYLPSSLALFQNTSLNANYYFWNFGDGSTSSDNTPWHIYDTIGYFTVTLVAINNLCGSDTLVKTNYIHVDIMSGNELNVIVNDLKVYGVENITEVIDFFDGKTELEQTIIDVQFEFNKS